MEAEEKETFDCVVACESRPYEPMQSIAAVSVGAE
jgi:hypothetical protein